MAKIKANEALVRALQAWDIDHLYGIPGDSIDAVVDNLRTVRDAFKFYHVRHEEVASLAAASYTKMTGKIGVALSIGGPGVVHLLNGMYDAKLDGVPQLILAGQTNSSLLGTKAFQETNITDMVSDVSVYSHQIQKGDNVFEVVNEAIRTAYEKKGVAVVICPNDLLNDKIKDTTHKAVDTMRPKAPSPKPRAVKKAAKLINKSKKPVMLVGVGAQNAREELREFVEAAKIPVIHTLPAKTVIPDDHPYSIGNLGKIGTKTSYQTMQDADLLIMVGTNYPYVDYLPKKNIKAIQIDTNPEIIGHRFDINVGIVGDSKVALHQLTETIKHVPKRAFLDKTLERKAVWDKWMDQDMRNESSPIRPERLMRSISEYKNDDAIFSIDVGTSTVWSTRYLNLSVNNKFIISSWLGTMGCGLPGAIAAKIAYPKRQAIAIVGDGAFQMVMQDFATAVQYDLPMTIFVMNNKQLSFIKYEQQAAGELEYAIDFSDMNHAKFAEAAGGKGYVLKDPNLIDDVVQAALAENQPTIVDVHVDPNAAPLPGKIVNDEALGYGKWAYRSVTEDKHLDLDQIPPISVAVKRFL
ncbi:MULTISPECIES: pyruvate oxidase [Staphylococcus]|uniref:pyruvate oxidase n=1 Tax=Staphylococcus TaxID=1279 RepID=UPI0001C547B6|nr:MULTISPECIES: pyruvate oxidase [Staphylococcus]ADC86602.1 Pyruvate oxidase, CidC/Pyruvate oxidase (ubiquinone, cytochrome) [Staphylococcus lugdunensis HKU09-01]ARJ08342.1 pyruvate oxidase [Staphylococcus lugdunensis]ARJ15431.1 pyruvate oxidase [Staphylococcus lugdunensis]EKS24017.1 pyruvate oxidase [Staphylococcus lugdunensis ACS-027-V-Sch2]MCH8651131.1 pyruvate oxidase [Staphylococcus lugdunensis]